MSRKSELALIRARAKMRDRRTMWLLNVLAVRLVAALGVVAAAAVILV